MMAMTDTSSDNEASIRELARSLDCILDSELQAIGEVKSSTTAAWRRRGEGASVYRFRERDPLPTRSCCGVPAIARARALPRIRQGSPRGLSGGLRGYWVRSSLADENVYDYARNTTKTKTP